MTNIYTILRSHVIFSFRSFVPRHQNIQQTSINGIIDHLHGNNPFLELELELGYVPNSATCSTNSIVELLYDGVGGAELKKLEQSSPKHALKAREPGLKGTFSPYWWTLQLCLRRVLLVLVDVINQD
jgi:hypothetical protein